MNENKPKVIAWIRSGMNYNEGVALLVKITGQNHFNSLMGKEKAHPMKPAYELCKAIGYGLPDWKQFIADTKDEPIMEPELHQIGDKLPELVESAREFGKTLIAVADHSPVLPVAPVADPNESIATKPLTEYPAVIRRVIHEYAQLFQERSKLHAEMAGMPESNADSVCVKRAEIFDVIKALSERIEFLFTTKEAFDKTGIVPDEKEVFPPAVKKEEPLSLDEAAIKKQIKNLQSGNSKDLTILDYQAKSRQPEKNPMPAGTKRKKIEMRMADRNKEIAKLEEQLLKPCC